MAEFGELEKADAVRMTWNVWPNSRVEATKCVIPFAAIYTPNKVLEQMPVSSAPFLQKYVIALEHIIPKILGLCILQFLPQVPDARRSFTTFKLTKR